MAVISDPISDFLIRLKNASRAGNETFLAPHSKMKEAIAKILQDEGYIWNYEVKEDGKFKELLVKV
ncbi:MAG: uS8 family ribosomal protein, partial [Akkermansiaceae bacterium]